MSDAPAAPVTENGVPPAAQEKVEETPGFKVRPATDFDVAQDNSRYLSLSSRSLPAILRTPPRMKG